MAQRVSKDQPWQPASLPSLEGIHQAMLVSIYPSYLSHTNTLSGPPFLSIQPIGAVWTFGWSWVGPCEPVVGLVCLKVSQYSDIIY